MRSLLRWRAVYYLSRKPARTGVMGSNYSQGMWQDWDAGTGCHCCHSLVIPGREGPQRFLFRLWRILFRFCCCWAIGVWAAESNCHDLFNGEVLIKNCAWRKCDILSFTVKFTKGDESEGSCSYYRVPSLHLHFVNTVLEDLTENPAGKESTGWSCLPKVAV